MTSELVEVTKNAYLAGSFPMSEEGQLGFYTCSPRSVFFFDSFHIPKRLKRIYRQCPFELKIDKAFGDVVERCRLGRKEWISNLLVEIYIELFNSGHAHSFEAWKDGELVGGVYGTHFGAAFLAESMFHSKTHASNICIVFMMEKLREAGFHFCDIQYANEHTARFSLTDLQHEEFMKIFNQAVDVPTHL